MHAKSGFKHRLWAQTARFVQLHPQVQHLAVVVVMPHRRLNLGPALLPQQLQSFLDGVIWLSLEELGEQPEHDPLLTLLTLPVLPKPDIPGATKQILEPLEGEARGRAAEAAAVALRLLNRRCGPLSTAGAAGREALSSSGSQWRQQPQPSRQAPEPSCCERRSAQNRRYG